MECEAILREKLTEVPPLRARHPPMEIEFTGVPSAYAPRALVFLTSRTLSNNVSCSLCSNILLDMRVTPRTRTKFN